MSMPLKKWGPCTVTPTISDVTVWSVAIHWLPMWLSFVSNSTKLLPTKSIEELFRDALERKDYGPLNKLSNRLMEADYRLATRLGSPEQTNRYKDFFETFAGSNFITFNYDSLPEIFLHQSKCWYPHDGFGVPVEFDRIPQLLVKQAGPVEPSLGPADTYSQNSTSLVLHLHGSFCVYSAHGTRYRFDPDSISNCFLPYRRFLSTERVPIEKRVIAPIPDKAEQLKQPFISETYSRACSLVRESGALVAIGYSFNSHDNASYGPILAALSESRDRKLSVVSPEASKLAEQIEGARIVLSKSSRSTKPSRLGRKIRSAISLIRLGDKRCLFSNRTSLTGPP